MPRPRWEKLDEDRRRSVLQIASDEFAGHGFEQASFNRIIDRAGLSKGAVYYYFDDKEDLFATVVRQALGIFRSVLGSFGPVSTPDEFWSEFDHYLRRGANYKASNPIFVKLGMALMRLVRNNRSSLAMKVVYREFMDQLEEIFRQGQAVGAVRSDMPAHLLVSMVFSAGEALQEWFMEGIESGRIDLSTLDFELGMKQTMSMYRRLLLPGDEPPLAAIVGVRTKDEEKNR